VGVIVGGEAGILLRVSRWWSPSSRTTFLQSSAEDRRLREKLRFATGVFENIRAALSEGCYGKKAGTLDLTARERRIGGCSSPRTMYLRRADRELRQASTRSCSRE